MLSTVHRLLPLSGFTRRNLHTTIRRAAGDRLWGGRFTGETDPLMVQFNNSIDFDKRWCFVDLQGSKAYARATERVGILTAEEADQMIEGLDQVEQEKQRLVLEKDMIEYVLECREKQENMMVDYD